MPKEKTIIGLGGAPTRPTTFAKTSEGRKETPVASGVLDYFPDAILAVAEVSFKGSKQHHPDKPIHWDRSKSGEEADKMMNHFMQRGLRDEDGSRHMAKAVWRGLALLQKEIEEDEKLARVIEAFEGHVQDYYEIYPAKF